RPRPWLRGGVSFAALSSGRLLFSSAGRKSREPPPAARATGEAAPLGRGNVSAPAPVGPGAREVKVGQTRPYGPPPTGPRQTGKERLSRKRPVGEVPGEDRSGQGRQRGNPAGSAP